MQTARHTFEVDTSTEIVDAIGCPAFIIDVSPGPVFSLTALNAAHVDVSGLDIAILGGKPLHEVLPGRLADTVAANYAVCANTRATHRYREVLQLGGREIHWDTTLAPMFGSDGNVVRILGTATDITDLVEDAEKAEAEAVELVERFENLQHFQTMIAHDLRAPVGNITSLLDMVAGGTDGLSDKQNRRLEAVTKLADTVYDQLDGMLQYADTLRLQKSTDLDELDIGHLCRDLAASLDPLRRLDITMPEGLLVSDKIAVSMILRNLLSNAVINASTQVVVSVDTTRKGLLRLCVADDGPGMVDLPDVTDDQFATNHGYGLAAVQRLAKTHGGVMRVLKRGPLSGAAIEVLFPGDVHSPRACR